MRKRFLIIIIFFLIYAYSFAGLNIWTQATETEGWKIVSIDIDTTTPGRIYTGTFGVFRSYDYGSTWIYSDYPPSLVAGDFAVDPTNPNIVYAGVADFLGPYKSIDQGSTWFQISSDLNMAELFGLEIDPSDISRMYAGGGISGSAGTAPFWASYDTGYHWQHSYTGMTSNQGATYTLVRHPQNLNIYYAGVDGNPSVYVTFDSCSIWQSKPFYFGVVKSLAMDPLNPNTLYAGLYGSLAYENRGELWMSTNSGDTWLKISAYTTIQPVMDIVVNPENTDIIYTATYGAGIWKTRNKGITWSPMTTGLPQKYIYCFAYDSTNHTLYAGTVVNSGFDTPRGLWMYTDTELSSIFPVGIEERIWQFFE